jgi:hypothetical protein
MVYYILGFGVTTAIGLSPFLGTANVLGFRALLSMFPTSPFDTTKTVIPLAAFFMGTVCVIVQYVAIERPGALALRRLFIISSSIVVVAGLVLLVVHTLTVARITVPAADIEISVLVGYKRNPGCPSCTPEMPDTACLAETTLDPAIIMSCWNERAIRLSFLLFAGLYFAMTCGFGAMIGGLILRERLKDELD